MTDTTSDTTAESNETEAVDEGFTYHGPFTLGDLLSSLSQGMTDEQRAQVSQPRMGSLPEVQYCILRALSPYLSDSSVESGYYGTRYKLPLRNGQTAVITIDVSQEDKTATHG